MNVILKNLYQGENSVKMMIRNGEKIYQQLNKFVFDVDKDSIEFPASGDTDTITITANENWTMTVPSWLTASAVSGRSSATITLTSQPTEETLEGDIVITCNGVAKTVNVTAGVHDYSKDYLTIEALEDGEINFDKRLYYSINNGEWMEKSGIAHPTIAVSNGDKVRFKGSVSPDIGFFSTTQIRFNVYGNVESLKYGDNFIGKTDFLKMKAMFSFSNVVSAKNLIIPSPIVINPDDDAPFEDMFYDCKQLIEAPALPATTLDAYSYRYMFQGCISLTTAPELPAATLASNCYNQMFYGCTNLNYVKCLATDLSARNCVKNWLTSVSPTGTFVKKAGVTWPTGNSGIPSGWTVIEE